MIRILCGSANAVLGLCTIVLGIVVPRLNGGGSQEELNFLGMCALLFLAVAFGILFRKRWITVVAGLPLFLGGILFALFIGLGAWAWGPGNALTANVLVAAGILVALLELGSIVASRRPGGPREASVSASGS